MLYEVITGALVAGRRGRAFGAVEALRDQAGDGRLADAAQTRKEIGVVQPVLRHGVLQGGHDRLLTDDLLERLRTILAGENLIAHGRITLRA